LVRKLFLSLFLLVVLVGCSTSISPVSLNDPLSANAETPYLCVTEDGYQQILKEGYDKGYADAVGCKPDVVLCYPSYNELVAWLKVEESRRCYAENCAQRLGDFSNSARAQKYDMWVVMMVSTDGDGHVIAAFPTNDRGVVFVDPTDNTIVQEPKMGQDYSINFPNAPSKIIEEVNIAK